MGGWVDAKVWTQVWWFIIESCLIHVATASTWSCHVLYFNYCAADHVTECIGINVFIAVYLVQFELPLLIICFIATSYSITWFSWVTWCEQYQ
jgi:hypothetical protein